MIVPTPVQAGIYDANTEVTYKEYWVPHSQFTGGLAKDANGDYLPGCVASDPTGGAFYLEPVNNCNKTVTFTIPDNFAGAQKIEIYLDLWRNHEPEYVTINRRRVLNKASAAFQINGSSYWFETHPIGYNWSRTPFITDTVRATDADGVIIPASVTSLKSLFRQGENTIVFKEIGGLYHIHDIAIRIYFNDQNPLLDPQGNPIVAPQGQLLTIWADNGIFNANAGGNLLVDDDQLVLTANIASAAKFVEFHGYYQGYDEDNNDIDNDNGPLDRDWHNRGRNNFHPGGTDPQLGGGTIDHIGTVVTPKPGTYSAYWNLPHILSQNDVKFKIRIVDQNNVVREAAGGISAPFNLTRTGTTIAYYTTNWVDFVLWNDGTRAFTVTKTMNLPSTFNPANYQEAYLLGSFWRTPFISVNNKTKFRAFTAEEDIWGLSVRRINPNDLKAGTNTLTYSHISGYGEFVEKPGPLFIVKTRARPVDNNPPTIIGRTPAANATGVVSNTTVIVKVADAGRGVNMNTLRLRINGALVTPEITGSPDEYTLTYTPPVNFPRNALVTVTVDGCDYGNRCMTTGNSYSFRIATGRYTLTPVAFGRGEVAISPVKAQYAYGEVVTLSATPVANWQLQGWALGQDNWLVSSRSYRIPLTLGANGYARIDKPADLPINFTALFNSMGQNNTFDPASLLVVEVDNNGQLLDTDVPFQFDQATNYHATTNAAGTLVILLKGNTAADGLRTYQIYFDRTGKSFTPPIFTDLVVRSTVTDEGQESFRFTTSNATYDYHKVGAGFSSLLDVDGNDWLGYHPTPVSGGGAFRGMPNMVPPPNGLFHPGNSTGTTTLTSDGPLKETILSSTPDGKWEVQWEIFPTYARMTVLKRDPTKNYWFLYEGTPGGENPAGENPPCPSPPTCPLETTTDFVTFSHGLRLTLDNHIGGDLPNPEWVYFSDPDVDNSDNVARSIFLVNHDDDSAVDSYRPDTDVYPKMTIFGFGRGLEGNTTYLSTTPKRFTVGLMDTTDFTAASAVINAAYQDLLVNWGVAQQQAVSTSQFASTPITLTVTGNTVITGTFYPTVQYNLNVTIVGGGAVSKDPNFPAYAPGDVVSLLATASPGSIFAGWSGDLSGLTNPATVTMTATKNIVATFKTLRTVNVTAAGPGSVAINPQKPSYFDGEVVVLTATPQPDFAFAGWSGSVVTGTNPLSLVVNGDMNIVGSFQMGRGLTVNKTGNGSVTINPQKTIYANGETVTLTATPANGWGFGGWSGDLTGRTTPIVLTMDANKTVTANFKELFPVQVNTTGNGSVIYSPNQPLHMDGDTVVITPTADTGWVFANWSGDLSGDTIPGTLLVDGSKVVTANFARATRLTLTTEGGGSVVTVPFRDPYPQGATVALTATAEAGWVFAGWSGDLSGNNPAALLVMDSNKTVKATFTRLLYTLATAKRGNGAVQKQPNQQTHFYNDIVTVRATADQGWFFTGWWGVVNGDTNPVTVTITGNAVISATFTQNPFTLVTNKVGGGAVSTSPPQALYAGGDVVMLTATPEAGWRFDSWSGDLSAITNPAQLIIDGNKVVTATFVQSEEYRVVVTPNGEGTVTLEPNQAVYHYGDVVTIRAIPNGGQTFTGWSGDLNGDQNPATITVDGNKNIVAHFTQSPRTITTNVNGSGQVVVNPTRVVYNPDEVVSVVAVPEPGAMFTGWSGDLTGTDNPGQLTMNGNKTVTANFAPEPPYLGAKSDDFNRCTLNTNVWSFVNPKNDATLALNGAEAVIIVPGGAEHNVWEDGITAPHLRQAVDNRDFEIDVKFASLLNKRFQMQGLIISQDDKNLLRINFQSDGTTVSLYAAKFVTGQKPRKIAQVNLTNGEALQYMRVKRTGDTWEVFYSTDGMTWLTASELRFKHAMIVSGVGIFAGNAVGSNANPSRTPAHTAVIDYFINKVKPLPYNTEDPLPNSLPVAVVGQGTVSKSATCGSPTTLTAQPLTGWNFVGWSGAISSNAATVEVSFRPGDVVTATFTAATFALNVSTTGSGAVATEPLQTNYAFGTLVTLSATAQPGWEFAGWSGGIVTTTNPLVFPVRKNLQLTANFVEARYAIATTLEGQGSITFTPNKTEYMPGEQVSVQATPASGWLFLGWAGDLSGNTNPATLTMDADKAITAIFVLDKEATFTATTGGRVTVEPDKPYYAIGEQVKLTAVPDPGYEFTGWIFKDSSALFVESNENPLTITLDGNTQYQAQFRSLTGGTPLYLPVIRSQ